MNTVRKHTGFSFVELLVVVAILGILLTLLVPAISIAIYRTELAICSSQLRGITSGAMIYAADYGRKYPLPQDGRVGRPTYLGSTDPRFYASDLRPLIRSYISLDLFVCPLVETVSLETTDTGTSIVDATYTFWMGWQYTPANAPKEAGMFRVGDRWSWSNRKYRLFANDYDLLYDNLGHAEGSHPDSDEAMRAIYYQNEEGRTVSAWQTDGAPRGQLDLNAAFDDASVARYTKLIVRDERTTPVPMNGSGNLSSTQFFFFVPR